MERSAILVTKSAISHLTQTFTQPSNHTTLIYVPITQRITQPFTQPSTQPITQGLDLENLVQSTRNFIIFISTLQLLAISKFESSVIYKRFLTLVPYHGIVGGQMA
jgi:hypothetical protein